MRTTLIPITVILIFSSCGKKDSSSNKDKQDSNIITETQCFESDINFFPSEASGEQPLQVTFQVSSTYPLLKIEADFFETGVSDEITFKESPTTSWTSSVEYNPAGGKKEFNPTFKLHYQKGEKQCLISKSSKIIITEKCEKPEWSLGLGLSTGGQEPAPVVIGQGYIMIDTKITKGNVDYFEVDMDGDNNFETVATCTAIQNYPDRCRLFIPATYGDWAVIMKAHNTCGTFSDPRGNSLVYPYGFLSLFSSYNIGKGGIADYKNQKIFVSGKSYISVLGTQNVYSPNIITRVYIGDTAISAQIDKDRDTIYFLGEGGRNIYFLSATDSPKIERTYNDNKIPGASDMKIIKFQDNTTGLVVANPGSSFGPKLFIYNISNPENPPSLLCETDIGDSDAKIKVTSDSGILLLGYSTIAFYSTNKLTDYCNITFKDKVTEQLSQNTFFLDFDIYEESSTSTKIFATIFSGQSAQKENLVFVYNLDRTTGKLSKIISFEINSNPIYTSIKPSTLKVIGDKLFIAYTGQDPGGNVRVFSQPFTSPNLSNEIVVSSKITNILDLGDYVSFIGEGGSAEIYCNTPLVCGGTLSKISTRYISSSFSKSKNSITITTDCVKNSANMFLAMEQAGLDQLDISSSLVTPGLSPRFIKNFTLAEVGKLMSINSVWSDGITLIWTIFTEGSKAGAYSPAGFFYPQDIRIYLEGIQPQIISYNNNFVLLGRYEAPSGIWYAHFPDTQYFANKSDLPARDIKSADKYFFILTSNKIEIREAVVKSSAPEDILPKISETDANCYGIEVAKLKNSDTYSIFCVHPGGIVTMIFDPATKMITNIATKIFWANIGTEIKDTSYSNGFIYILGKGIFSDILSVVDVTNTKNPKIVQNIEIRALFSAEGTRAYDLDSSTSCSERTVILSVQGDFISSPIKLLTFKY